MKKGNLLKFMMLFLLLGGAINASAEEVVCKTIDFTKKSAKSQSYTQSWDYDGWTLYRAANNNGGWEYIKFSGKGVSEVEGTITGTAPIADEITKVVISHNGVDNTNDVTVHSISITVADNDEFANATTVDAEKFDISNKEGTVEIIPTIAWAANKYYKIIIPVG